MTFIECDGMFSPGDRTERKSNVALNGMRVQGDLLGGQIAARKIMAV